MKYKAEMWDKMQQVMEFYNDHMTHCYMQFDKALDEKLLKKAVILAINKVPILKSNYKAGIFNASWKAIDDFDFNDVYEFRLTNDDLLEECDKFSLVKIDERKEAQFKMLHLRKDNKDAVSFVINHQVMDGADLKVFYSHIADIYTNLVNGGDGNLPFKNGSRSHEQIYKAMTKEEVEKINAMISYSKKQKSKIAFPFEKSERKDQYAKINKLIIDAKMFSKIKANTKALGVTINDAILASFYKTAYKMIDIKKDETLGIPNMINLRRYIPGGESEACTNLTSMTVINLGNDIGKDIFETAILCRKSMDEVKDNYPGLQGLSLLKFAFNIFPYSIAKIVIGTFFKNPLIGISNIGIVDEKAFVFGNAKMDYMYMTGSVKYPPYMQLALTTFKNEITFSIANYGTDKDHEMLITLLENIKTELSVFANEVMNEEFLARFK